MTGRNKDELDTDLWLLAARGKKDSGWQARPVCRSSDSQGGLACKMQNRSYDGNAFLKPRRNKLLPRNSEVSLSRHSPVIPIPAAVVEQEAEIELMFRHLIRFSDSAYLRDSQNRADRAREQHTAAWILIVIFALVSIAGFYLLGENSIFSTITR
jgi:hypothetical protein